MICLLIKGSHLCYISTLYMLSDQDNFTTQINSHKDLNVITQKRSYACLQDGDVGSTDAEV
jgi:hypothetical protein